MRTRRQVKEAEVDSASQPSSPASPVFTSRPSSPASPDLSVSKVEGSKNLATRSRSKLPKLLQFPLVAILNLSLSALGYSLAHSSTKGILATHARVLEDWTEVGTLMLWRILELAFGWYGNYDGYDLAALNLLSHGPPLYLLSAFYKTPPTALVLTLAIETFSTYVPFRLLRPLSVAHVDPAHAPNAELITDRPIAILTSLLSGIIYTVTLFAAYKTYLPYYLVVHFDSLPSIVAAHEATYVNLLPVTLTLGFAASIFIFNPAEAQEEDKNKAKFDPVAASLRETVWWNVWGWSNRTKFVIKRTLALMLVTAGNTAIQTALTIQGAELPGAVAWASVWVMAAAITGAGLGLVGGV